jgi:hypothetical protein
LQGENATNLLLFSLHSYSLPLKLSEQPTGIQIQTQDPLWAEEDPLFRCLNFNRRLSELDSY